jgi:hypothetical protein
MARPKAVARAVWRLNVKLVLVVVLLCLDIGTHILRQHQPNRVSLGLQQPTEMMAAIGFPSL